MKKMSKISRSVLLSALAALAFGGERGWKSELFSRLFRISLIDNIKRYSIFKKKCRMFGNQIFIMIFANNIEKNIHLFCFFCFY